MTEPAEEAPSAPYRADPRHAVLGSLKEEMCWQTPQGHWGMVEVRREFEAVVTTPGGGQKSTNVGTNYEHAVRLADAPKDWTPPGQPGVIRYHDVVTITGAWALVEPPDLGHVPTPTSAEIG